MINYSNIWMFDVRLTYIINIMDVCIIHTYNSIVDLSLVESSFFSFLFSSWIDEIMLYNNR